ncbi:hypothetical protein Cme02nite_72800 [Catellatospora methionotrophica]|uniref:Uncharacterized protein n=1 Tax=Catellatospora methionotrophica TaxID=121620 RepID=A0A8J3PJY0_9ACTN|nr:hypothetical protein [Catellatospora methionotrophica]GIG18948.1 hypothetical protein Cme02nite_72800 [Catellatospora methionotrophica]
MSSATLLTAGILLITVSTIVFGGLSLLMSIVKRIPGYLDNPVRRALWTAGHAHAGVLVIFALVALPYLDRTGYGPGTQTLVRALLVAPPIVMALGFFLSVARPSDTKPNKLIWLVPLGGASLAAGTLILGLGLV